MDAVVVWNTQALKVFFTKIILQGKGARGEGNSSVKFTKVTVF